MAKNSSIEWTHHTFNPWWGCTKVSPGCKHCYAETFAHRIGENIWGAKADRRFFSDAHWDEPLRWNKAAEKDGARRRVFCASMADVFERRADLDGTRTRLWNLIESTPALDWLLLTKRPEWIASSVPWSGNWPDNVWLGVTAENQRWAEKRLPFLQRMQVAVRFVSCEPLVGGVDLSKWLIGPRKIDWVIAGGESGHKARPMDPAWAQSLRDQCRRSGAAFFFKQWGNWRPVAPHVVGTNKRVRLVEFADKQVAFERVGKHAAGRSLDGRIWDQFPRPRSLDGRFAEAV